MQITEELIDYLQKLGRIRLSEEDRQKTMKDLSSIMGYIDKLNELDTTGVEPLSHVFGRTNVVREDEVTNGDMRDKIIKRFAAGTIGVCFAYALIRQPFAVMKNPDELITAASQSAKESQQKRLSSLHAALTDLSVRSSPRI